MKKLRYISLILVVVMIFSATSIVSASAATKELDSVSVVSMPETMCTNGYDYLLNGVVLKATYTDKSTKEFTVNSSSATTFLSDTYIDEVGFGTAIYKVDIDDTNYIIVMAEIYVSDFINLYIVNSNAYEAMPTPVKYTYPSSFECPKYFANNYCCYATNPDGTLILESFVPSLSIMSEPMDSYTIPETVHGKTVTAIEDYAFCSLTAPVAPLSITVPKTVTSIGKCAFGYTTYDMTDYGSIDGDLYKMLQNANDTDEFEISLYIYLEDTEEVEAKFIYIMNTYFPELDESEWSSELTATKSQILAMQNEEDILIYSEVIYPEDEYPSLSEDLLKLVETMPADTKLPICVSLDDWSTQTQVKADATKFMKTYMNGSTDYTIDLEYGEFCFTATVQQIIPMNDCDYAYVELQDPYNIGTELYSKLLMMSDTDTLDTVIMYLGEDDPQSALEEFRTLYFPNNSYHYDSRFVLLLYVDDVTKDQIFALPPESNFEIADTDYDLDTYPIKNFTVYGYRGSATSEYALENSFKFVDISGNYKNGDVNLDGKVNIADATEIQKYGIDKVTLNETQLKLADANQDGRVNIMDATEIQKYLIGKVEIH